jgi:hypothetical protein
MEMNQNEKIRDMVSTVYGKAIALPSTGCGCNAQKENCPIADMAGYEKTDIYTLNSDVAANSFACGNPLAFSGVKEGDTVLDLGSGAGLDLILAAKKVGPDGHVIGVDMTEAMIVKATENIKAEGLVNVEVRRGLIEQLPVESASVDWLISNSHPAQSREDLIDQMTMNAVGNVWSAEFYAKKPSKKMKRSSDEIINRMIKLAGSKYNCSQIMMILTLEQEDCENPGLVRAMSGLGVGCGFLNETCGVMTSAASLLAWYGGKGSDNEAESEKLLPMLQDLGEWFRQKIASKFKGTSCKDIVGDQVGTSAGIQICGELIFNTYNKVNEILTSYGFTDF